MSKSYHVTRRNFRGMTKGELNKMAEEPYSDLHEWAEKSHIKKEVINERKLAKAIKENQS